MTRSTKINNLVIANPAKKNQLNDLHKAQIARTWTVYLTETKKETSVCNPLCRKSQENKTKPWQTIEGSVRIQSELARKVINLRKKKNCLQNILLSENLYLVPIQKAFSKQTLDKQMNEIYRRIELKTLLKTDKKI